jgi:glycosyltransferase involved in cell wall biosynthesis
VDKLNFSIVVPALDEEDIILNLLSEFTKERKAKYGFEVILSDGGSNDKTIEISKPFIEKVEVHHENSQTIGAGRNDGAVLASSKNIIFLNADTKLKNADKFLQIITDWSNNKGKYGKFNALAGRVEPDPKDIIWKDRIFYFIFNKYFNFLNIINIGMGRGECQVIRKELFDQLGGYNSEIAAGEDFDLFHRVAKKEKVKFANDLVVFESPRRFRKKGYINTVALWFFNSLWVWISGHSISKKWEKVR